MATGRCTSGLFHALAAGLLAALSAGCAPMADPPRAAPPAASATPAGTVWLAEDLGGGGIIDRSHVTLLLGDAGRASGSAGCNRYTIGYALDGDGLKLEPAATTRMACAPALMAQESKYLDLLRQVVRWRIEPTGALVLSADSSDVLRFFPAEKGASPQ
nr:META domain-containing protein [Sphingomonas sp. SCN 67-18]